MKTVTVPVFILRDSVGPEDLIDPMSAVDSLSFCPSNIIPENGYAIDSWRVVEQDGLRIRVPAGWTFAGLADVTLRLTDMNGLVAEKVESLRAKRVEVLAKAQAEATQIERQINTLLAIEHTLRERAAA